MSRAREKAAAYLCLVLCALFGLAGCAPRTIYVDRVREVKVYVPQPVAVPAALVAPCPPFHEDPNVGQVLDDLSLCVQLLDHQRRQVAELK